jgi:prevent-host-death family protein
MKRVSASEVQANFGEYLIRSQTEGPISIVQDGKTVAVLAAPRDEDDAESIVLARSPKFQSMLAASRESIAKNGGLSRDEFWAAVEQRAKEKESANDNE